MDARGHFPIRTPLCTPLVGICVKKAPTMLSSNVQSIDPLMDCTAWRSGRWDNRMADQHLARDLVRPSSVLEELAPTTTIVISAKLSILRGAKAPNILFWYKESETLTQKYKQPKQLRKTFGDFSQTKTKKRTKTVENLDIQHSNWNLFNALNLTLANKI